MSKTVDQVYDLLKKDFEHDQAQMAFIFLNFCILCVILVLVLIMYTVMPRDKPMPAYQPPMSPTPPAPAPPAGAPMASMPPPKQSQYMPPRY